ncbi:MAG: GxxExxY protein [Prevotellaceae bacterium]|nr:GxxExxY protein [Candidatus Faecinaster equi]
MDFSKVSHNIQKFIDVDLELCQKLRQYCYPIVGCCQEVHKEMGPFLNEYMYQDALVFALEDAGFTNDNLVKEYYFKTKYKDHEIKHTHKVDFLVNKKVFVECKAVESLNSECRQQLWNYMRLSGIKIGILYNFAPINDQCERYYYAPEKQAIFAF